VIKDAGPPAANRYASADVFWNSTMIDSDYTEKERRQARVWGAPFTIRVTNTTNSVEAKPSQDKQSATGLDYIQEEGRKPAATRVKPSKPKKSNRPNLDRLDRRISYGKERANNDLIVMVYREPDYDPPPRPERTRRSGSISPGTRECDKFADFDFDFDFNNPMHIYHAEADSPHVVTEYSMTGHDPQALTDSPAGKSSSITPESPTLTWNSCLSQILTNAHVDPEAKDAVRDRLQNSRTMNGFGDKDYVFVSTIEAGLVPNFSYPVDGSAFYDRLHAKKLRQRALNRQIKDTKSDDVATRNSKPNTLTDSSLTPKKHPPKPNIPKGVPSEQSSSSSSMTSDFLYHHPTPDDHTPRIPGRIRALLRTNLTPSELHLCRQVLTSIPSNNPPSFPPSKLKPKKPIYNPTDPPIRLIGKLHAIIHGLQDRIMHLEDVLLPQLGEALEKKTYTIHVFSIEIQNLNDQIKELKTTVDFGNKILAGCWLREYEVWRTLAGIRQKRAARSGLRFLKRWTRRSRVIRGVQEGVLSPLQEMPESKVSRRNGRLTDRELDALILMAEQNVSILREDVEEMVEMVEKCKRDFVAFPAVDVVEGSWRDV
jgi:hypothetical protein